MLGASGDPAGRLTDLYQLAKFSLHPVDETMKRQALEALVELRDELQARAQAETAAAQAVPA
jgi:hypothetical protein